MRSAGLAFVIALALAAGASAEIVAPGVRDGRVAVAPSGTPLVAYVRGSSLVIAARTSPARWSILHAHRIAPDSSLVAFAAGADGPIAIVEGAEARTLLLLRREGPAWSAIPLASR